MGLKKKNKVSAEFSMSSLTDIIFLLLIFFMLTSSLVKFDRFDLLKSDTKAIAPTSINVTIEKNGVYTLNSRPTAQRDLKGAISRAKNKTTNQENATLTIVAEVGVPFEKVVSLMDIANQLRMKAILATEPRE